MSLQQPFKQNNEILKKVEPVGPTGEFRASNLKNNKTKYTLDSRIHFLMKTLNKDYKRKH